MGKGQTTQTLKSQAPALPTLSHHLALSKERRLSASEFSYCLWVDDLSSTYDFAFLERLGPGLPCFLLSV